MHTIIMYIWTCTSKYSFEREHIVQHNWSTLKGICAYDELEFEHLMHDDDNSASSRFDQETNNPS